MLTIKNTISKQETQGPYPSPHSVHSHSTSILLKNKILMQQQKDLSCSYHPSPPPIKSSGELTIQISCYYLPYKQGKQTPNPLQ